MNGQGLCAGAYLFVLHKQAAQTIATGAHDDRKPPVSQRRTMIATPTSKCGAGLARAVQERPAAAACGVAPGGACRITGPARCARSCAAPGARVWGGGFGLG